MVSKNLKWIPPASVHTTMYIYPTWVTAQYSSIQITGFDVAWIKNQEANSKTFGYLYSMHAECSSLKISVVMTHNKWQVWLSKYESLTNFSHCVCTSSYWTKTSRRLHVNYFKNHTNHEQFEMMGVDHAQCLTKARTRNGKFSKWMIYVSRMIRKKFNRSCKTFVTTLYYKQNCLVLCTYDVAKNTQFLHSCNGWTGLHELMFIFF